VAERTAESAGGTPEADASTEPEGDLADASVDQQVWDTGHQDLLDREAQLAEVEHALGKFALGTYGVCEKCGRPIRLRGCAWCPRPATMSHMLQGWRPPWGKQPGCATLNRDPWPVKLPRFGGHL
jgi:hypothetical protein